MSREDRAEICFERIQPWLEVSPLFKPLAEDRPAHLLGARRAYRALVLVEAQAGGLERQRAMPEELADLCLGVVDQPLVKHAMHAPGQHRVEMRHEGDVVAVVAAEVVEPVGEVLAACEVLLEAREAAAERMTAGVDDAGIGQDRLNEPDIQAVVRHLVDEKRRAALAQDARALEVALAESGELGARQGAHRREETVRGCGLAGGPREARQRARSLVDGKARPVLADGPGPRKAHAGS